MRCPVCQEDVSIVRVVVLPRDPAKPDEINKVEGCGSCLVSRHGRPEDRTAGRRDIVLAHGPNGIKVTQAEIDHRIEHGSKAERIPRPGGGYDLEPVTLRSVKRKTFLMGARA